MADRCTCLLLPASPPVWDRCTCSQHGDADTILASRRYVDRRGREWRKVTPIIVPSNEFWETTAPWLAATPAQMRLRIVREQHRDECPGLRDCMDHPVTVVMRELDGDFGVYPPRSDRDDVSAHTLAFAVDAALRLASTHQPHAMGPRSAQHTETQGECAPTRSGPETGRKDTT